MWLYIDWLQQSSNRLKVSTDVRKSSLCWTKQKDYYIYLYNWIKINWDLGKLKGWNYKKYAKYIVQINNYLINQIS